MIEVLAHDSGWELRAEINDVVGGGMYQVLAPWRSRDPGRSIVIHPDELAAVRALLDVAESHWLAMTDPPAERGPDGVSGPEGPVGEPGVQIPFDEARFQELVGDGFAQRRRSWWRRLFG